MPRESLDGPEDLPKQAPRQVALGQRQLFVDRCLDRHADVLVNQFAERDRWVLLRFCRLPDT